VAEKTEKPTPKKIDDSRKKGQVAFSRDFSSMLVTLAGFGVLVATSSAFVAASQSWFKYVGTVYIDHSFYDALRMATYYVAVNALWLLLPFLVAILSIGAIGNYIQVGPLFAGKALKPDINRLNPVNNAKNIFSIKKLGETAINTIKLIVLGFVLYKVITLLLQDMVNAVSCGLPCILHVFDIAVIRILTFATMLFILMAAVDLIIKRLQYTKELMMSKEEIKQEYKETEGDPQIKSRRRQLAQEMAMNQVQQRVKTASVIVRNPDHIAIAMYYVSGKTPLPSVVAKGQGMMANLILKAANEAEVPMMQDVMLAQQIYQKVEVGHYIPSDMIESVAAVFRWLKTLKSDA